MATALGMQLIAAGRSGFVVKMRRPRPPDVPHMKDVIQADQRNSTDQVIFPGKGIEEHLLRFYFPVQQNSPPCRPFLPHMDRRWEK
jgi:hypothetical protein